MSAGSAGNSGLWAIYPCVVGGWEFPGLPGTFNPNNDEAWADLQQEIGHLLARLKILEKRRMMVGSVRTVAELGLQAAVERLLDLAKELEKA